MRRRAAADSRVGIRTRVVVVLALAIAAAAAIPACGGDDEGDSAPPLPAAPDQIEVTSENIRPGGPIPDLYTCDGLDFSPPLAFDKIPKGTKSLALVVNDPDASGDSSLHWSAYDFSPRINALGEGQDPFKSKQGENSFGKVIYSGPCPPDDDDPHDYEFALYALRGRTGLPAAAKPEAVLKAIERLAIARGVLTGRYERQP